MYKRLVLVLLLNGCGSDETLTISPHLSCVDYVKCHIIAWRIGMRGGPMLSGTHMVCKCDDTPERSEGLGVR